jgi:hypothetical protein
MHDRDLLTFVSDLVSWIGPEFRQENGDLPSPVFSHQLADNVLKKTKDHTFVKSAAPIMIIDRRINESFSGRVEF